MNLTKLLKAWDEKQEEVKEDKDNLEYFGAMNELGLEVVGA